MKRPIPSPLIIDMDKPDVKTKRLYYPIFIDFYGNSIEILIPEGAEEKEITEIINKELSIEESHINFPESITPGVILYVNIVSHCDCYYSDNYNISVDNAHLECFIEYTEKYPTCLGFIRSDISILNRIINKDDNFLKYLLIDFGMLLPHELAEKIIRESSDNAKIAMVDATRGNYFGKCEKYSYLARKYNDNFTKELLKDRDMYCE